jgi:hypothetical protein
MFYFLHYQISCDSLIIIYSKEYGMCLVYPLFGKSSNVVVFSLKESKLVLKNIFFYKILQVTKYV